MCNKFSSSRNVQFIVGVNSQMWNGLRYWMNIWTLRDEIALTFRAQNVLCHNMLSTTMKEISNELCSECFIFQLRVYQKLWSKRFCIYIHKLKKKIVPNNLYRDYGCRMSIVNVSSLQARTMVYLKLQHSSKP